jgi:hypothetical protein
MRNLISYSQQTDEALGIGDPGISTGLISWRNALCCGKINHGVKYINGSGAMTQPQGGNE